MSDQLLPCWYFAAWMAVASSNNVQLLNEETDRVSRISNASEASGRE